ncbi:phosphoinositide 3-kinase adapter protein 1 isoform X2 [Conger conger]|uniref:phosphoinositide 3-kinase adapter protein 1 isoform X2 n=1 Tax=Conger conger TaxID=82655 RepID=UPI002A5AABA4|nr:phosphoinositide 3-kinase adapter protein 1 isoform X2 [Conger conger]
MTEPAASASSSPCEVRILYTGEAEDWAFYLREVLRSSGRLSQEAVVLHPLSSATLQQHEQELVRESGSVVLLLSAAFVDFLRDPEVLATYQDIFHPPSKMVLLFCGVSENEVLEEPFQRWHSWRKLFTDDDPAQYISTVMDALSDRSSEPEAERDGAVAEAEAETETETETALEPEPETGPQTPTEELQPPEPPPETEPVPQRGCMVSRGAQIQPTASAQEPCLCIQPSRIQCGSQVNIFFILRCKMDPQARAEVEFSCQDCIPKREPGVFENEYTISVKSPDMPPGTVLVSLFCNDSVVCSRPIAYFTSMGEISSYLETALNPADFMCQAFNITSNRTEALDKLLTNSLRSRIPCNGLCIFGVSQVEEENMSTYERKEELPTILHFAAKFGLKELASLLLQCPGALQAYSVANKYGDYPNNMAEKHGFSDLRQFMDKYLETADKLKSPVTQSVTEEGDEEVYEPMAGGSQEMPFVPGCSEDIYESMMELDPDCMEDLYEDMDQALRQSLNPEEALLRKFFQGTTERHFTENEEEQREEEEEEEEEAEEEEGENAMSGEEEEEDPYNLCFPDQIYDTVDEHFGYVPDVTNRPPAPIPRPSVPTQPEDTKTYISRVFHEKPSDHRNTLTPGGPYSVPARPVRDRPSSSTYDPYAGMRTPGQRQLISLQERVKVGDLNVDDAVQEFKAWQQNQDKRSQSLRFQQENLKRLRDSINRRQKKQGKTGKDIEITAPLPPGQHGDSILQVECSVYETTSRSLTLPPTTRPPGRPMQRGSWQNGSSSSLSSEGSNRLSTHSTLSYSSGADADFEDSMDPLLPPRPPRSDPPPILPPPRVPPRIPERNNFSQHRRAVATPRAGDKHSQEQQKATGLNDRIPENPMMERYVLGPARSLPRLPQRPPSPPPIPRRTR